MHSQSAGDNSQGASGLAEPQILRTHLQATSHPGPTGGLQLWSSGHAGLPRQPSPAAEGAPCGRGRATCQPPANSGLKARLKAAAASVLREFSASYFFLVE